MQRVEEQKCKGPASRNSVDQLIEKLRNAQKVNSYRSFIGYNFGQLEPFLQKSANKRIVGINFVSTWTDFCSFDLETLKKKDL